MVTATQLLLLEKENSILFKVVDDWRNGNALVFDTNMRTFDPFIVCQIRRSVKTIGNKYPAK